METTTDGTGNATWRARCAKGGLWQDLVRSLAECPDHRFKPPFRSAASLVNLAIHGYCDSTEGNTVATQIRKRPWRNPACGPLGMNGGSGRPGGFGPVVEGKALPHHPFEPTAPAISKNKLLIVGYNRDETIFFLQH